MTESHNLDATTDAPASPSGQPTPPPTPVWVKIGAVVLALVVLAVLAKLAFGGGMAGHGPGMHTGLGTSSAPLAIAAADGPGAAPAQLR